MQSDHSSILTVSDSGSDTCSVSSSCIFFFFVFFAKFLQIFPKSYANKLAIHDFIGIGRGDETSESKDLGTNSIAGSMSFVFCWWFLFSESQGSYRAKSRWMLCTQGLCVTVEEPQTWEIGVFYHGLQVSL